MALTTEEAAVNTAVDTLITAWKAMITAKAANAQITAVPLRLNQSGSLHTRWVDATGTLRWDFSRKQVFSRELGNSSNLVPINVGIYPLFFKLTNAAGDLT